MNSAVFDILRKVTTATITHHAAQEGHPALLDERAEAAGAGRRAAGRAGLHAALRAGARGPRDAGSWAKPISTRAAIEAMPEGCIAVADAMGVTTAGIFGDILCVRMKRRGVTALVTDGVVRDKAGVLATGLPVWCAGMAAPASVNGLTFVGWQEPIGCGGVADLSRRRDRRRRRRRGGDPARTWSSSSPAKAPSTSATRAGSCARSRRACSCPASIRRTTRPRRATRPGRSS